jgi:hypothetical protein
MTTTLAEVPANTVVAYISHSDGPRTGILANVDYRRVGLVTGPSRMVGFHRVEVAGTPVMLADSTPVTVLESPARAGWALRHEGEV